MSKPDPEWENLSVVGPTQSTSEVFLQVAKRWPVIVVPMIAVAILAAGFAILRPKYEAVGFYYTPGWVLAEYKRFRSEFGSSDVLAAFLRESEPKDRDGAELLLARSLDPRFWETAVKPLYPITKRDAKEIFETTKDKESASIIGLDLSVQGADPTAARTAVLVLGDYLTQTLLLSSLQNWVTTGQASSNSELLKAGNQVLQTRYSVEQTRQRISEIRALQTKYPESQRMEARQVVSADAGSARYLAPIAQVVALESGVAESNEALRRMERRARQLKIETAFFDAAALEAMTARRGWTLLDRYLTIKQRVFGPLDLSDDTTREISNRFDLDLKGFRDQFSIGFGFRSPVLEPTRSSRSPLRLGLIGAAIGALIGLCLVLIPILLSGNRRGTSMSQLNFAESRT